MRVLTFRWLFDKLIVLTKNLKVLKFGHAFNKPIVLTKNLTVLILLGFFVKLNCLTPNIVHLDIGCYNYQLIDNLPNNVKHINIVFCSKIF